MKKGRILRTMFILAVTTIMIAATAVVASAATVNKNDADYKYSKTYDNGVKISFTTDVFGKKVVDDSVFCRIELPDGANYKEFSVSNEIIKSGKAFVDYTHLRDRYPVEIKQKWVTNGNVSYGMIGLTSAGGGLYTGTFKLKVYVETPDKDEMIEVAFLSDFAARPVDDSQGNFFNGVNDVGDGAAQLAGGGVFGSGWSLNVRTGDTDGAGGKKS